MSGHMSGHMMVIIMFNNNVAIIKSWIIATLANYFIKWFDNNAQVWVIIW